MSRESEPKVFVIIINWINLKDILECLESVYQLEYKNYEVVIVDNGSRDNSIEVIKHRFPMSHIIINNRNLGYAGGNNIGIRFSIEMGADYIWLLNNDTIVQKGSLKKMVDLGESDPNIGLISPVIYYFDEPEMPQFCGSYIDWKTLSIVYPDGSELINRISLREYDNVCLWGTALLIKRKLVEMIGYLREEYFAYWEDTEYSIRSLRNGFKNMVCTSVGIYHKTDRENMERCGRNSYYYYFMQRNRILLIRGYANGLINFFNCGRIYLAQLIRELGCCWRNKSFENLGFCLLGAWHGFKGISGDMKNVPTMPKVYVQIFVRLAKWHPFLLSSLLELNFKKVYAMVMSKIGEKMEFK